MLFLKLDGARYFRKIDKVEDKNNVNLYLNIVVSDNSGRFLSRLRSMKGWIEIQFKVYYEYLNVKPRRFLGTIRRNYGGRRD